jgi:hypothetical protein
VALGLLVVLGGWGARLQVDLAQDHLVVGQWQPLDVRAWAEATTGFRAPGQSDLPLVVEAGDPGLGFAAPRTAVVSLGLYPPAEVTYVLDEAVLHLSATVQVQPRPWYAQGAARLRAYGDGAPLYDSGVVDSRQPPRAVELGLAGVRELRLVVTPVEGQEPGLLYLADPHVLRAWVAAGGVGPRAGTAGRLLALRQQHQRQEVESRLRAQGAELGRQVRRWRVGAGPAEAVLAGRLPSGALVLSTPRLAVWLETDGAARGTVQVVDLGHGRLVASGVRPAVVLADGATRALADLRAGAPVEEPVQDAVLGPGTALRVPFASAGGDLAVTLELALFADSGAALFQLAADRPVQRFLLLDGAGEGVYVGDEPRYVTDFSRPREGRVRDDGLARSELVALGAPLFLWSERADAGLVLAVLDPTRLPPRYDLRRAPGDVRVQLTVATEPQQEAGATTTRSPRLYLEPTDTADPRRALAAFRALSLAQHPPPPLPAWVRHQWGSWYVYGTAIDEAKLREQIDYLADYLGDVGPWHVLLDAGWFVAEGRPGAAPERVDPAKFPSGIRALVDYAHARGIRMILYYAAPYIDTKPVVSEWLALPGFIEQHPEWLIPLGATADQASYAYNFAHPGLRQYMRDLLRRYYVEWNADGLLVDMLGHTEGAALNLARPDPFGIVAPVLGQTLEIYRFLWEETQRLRPDAWVEGAWDNPLLARSYAHTWRFADDAPVFRNPYPFGGLVEHLDYAVLQYLLLAQRPHMGAVIGQPDNRINFWWLGAGLALGSQVVLSLPLTSIEPAELDEYRAYLTQMRPFEGETRLGEGLHPDTFATTREGTTFLGVLNRERAAREIAVDFSELGLDAAAAYHGYDVEQGKGFTARAGLVVRLEPESFRLYVLRHEPGVLWTTSSVRPAGPGCLRVRVEGPAVVPGVLHAYTPVPSAVYLDSRALPELPVGVEGWQYDAASGLLTVRYLHRGVEELRVEC